MKQILIQFIKFGMVGVTNTLISYFTYVIALVGIKRADLFVGYDYLIAQTIAFVLSVLWSFYWNNKLVFVKGEESNRVLWKTLFKTFVAYSFTGLFLNNVLLLLWVQFLGISEYIAPILNLLFSVPLNFLLNKFWAFK